MSNLIIKVGRKKLYTTVYSVRDSQGNDISLEESSTLARTRKQAELDFFNSFRHELESGHFHYIDTACPIGTFEDETGIYI